MPFLARIGRLFPRNDSIETVATTVHFDVDPASVWRGMMFYEEVPRRPSPLLHLFLPAPVRTTGEKTRPGSIIQCTYEGSYLEKRITEAEAARYVRFEVLVQQLGIEDCISMEGGSYEIMPEGRGAELVLTTCYRGHLRPRRLFRPLEHFLAHRLHHHILDGMQAALVTREGEIPEPVLAAGPTK